MQTIKTTPEELYGNKSLLPNEQLQFLIQEASRHTFYGKKVFELTSEEQLAMIGYLALEIKKMKENISILPVKGD